ncbi:endocuticle structural glycoprotein SgAbd-1-like [Battus philenor]|uniref:endocuticle structural glycoprotein SgAbd-1-like n=1 Tax=Battus philenor TaxID=42288 RepID=UPI0035D0C051
MVLAAVCADQSDYYEPQTFRQMTSATLFQPAYLTWDSAMRIQKTENSYAKGLFTPAAPKDVTPQGSNAQTWKPGPAPPQDWRAPEPWQLPYGTNKEKHASILHHKQALTSQGSFRFEYASDNGLAAGEVIEPDGSRVGAYQYKDPSGRLVKLKYRAGKEGFQILEGSHLPRSPMPEQPRTDNYYQSEYDQQQYNTQKPEPQEWPQDQNQGSGGQTGAGGQYFVQNWKSGGNQDGQYHDNEVMEPNRPHSFGEGYAFAFKG